MDINLAELMTLKNALLASGGVVLASLIAGKTMKRLLLLPFKFIVSKTKTQEDDLILSEAAKDLGLPEDAAKRPTKETK
jgi:hypothetical protein